MNTILIHFPLILFFLIISPVRVDAQEVGYFIIDSNVQDFILVIDDDFENYLNISSGDTLSLPTGERSFRMIAPNINDNLFSKTIVSDTIVGMSIQITQFNRNPRSSYQQIINQSNIEIYTDPESSIFIDQEFIGKGYSNLFLAPDKYDLFITHPEHGSLKKSITASLAEPLTISRYNEPPRQKVILFNFLPAGGYLLNKEYKKAKFTYAGLGVLLAGLIHSELRYDYIKGKIADQNDTILSPENPGLVLSQSSYQYFSQSDLDRVQKRAERLTLSALLVYGITTIDGLRKPKQGYWDSPRTELSISAKELTGIPYPELKFSLKIK